MRTLRLHPSCHPAPCLAQERRADLEWQLAELRAQLDGQSGSSERLAEYELELGRLRREAEAARESAESAEAERLRVAAEAEQVQLGLRFELAAVKKALTISNQQVTALELREHHALEAAAAAEEAAAEAAREAVGLREAAQGRGEMLEGDREETRGREDGEKPLKPLKPLREKGRQGRAGEPGGVRSSSAPSSPQKSNTAQDKQDVSAAQGRQGRQGKQELVRLLHQSERARDEMSKQRDAHAQEVGR